MLARGCASEAPGLMGVGVGYAPLRRGICGEDSIDRRAVVVVAVGVAVTV